VPVRDPYLVALRMAWRKRRMNSARQFPSGNGMGSSCRRFSPAPRTSCQAVTKQSRAGRRS
jgi:hypothetical protein